MDDTKVYSCTNDIEKCGQLQIDLNDVYDCDSCKQHVFNAQKFNYSLNGLMTPCGSNVYTNPNVEEYLHQGMFLAWVSICRVTLPL